MGAKEEEAESMVDISLFQEPEGYYQAEKPPTWTEHTLLSGQKLKLRLVGHNPLWGHMLWNAGQVMSDYLQDNANRLVQGKAVLELGAGAGLPGLVCAVGGARKVVITDYPDADLIENLKHNIRHCEPMLDHGTILAAEGYLWGASLSPSLSDGFDLLILADLLFNHSEHGKLVKTLTLSMSHSASSRALVFFTPYRPWLLEKDLAFFDLARQEGFVVEKILEKVMDKVMFEQDRGDELLRRTVFGYELRWPYG